MKLSMVFGTNEDISPLQFSIDDFIINFNEHLPLIKFERVVLACEKLDWYSIDWCMKRTESLVIQRVSIKPLLDISDYEELNLNDNSLQTLTLIMP